MSTNAVQQRRAVARPTLTAVVLAVATLVLSLVTAGPAQSAPLAPQLASAPRDAIDAEFVRLINGARADAGLAPLTSAPGLRNLSVWWSSQLADGATGCRLEHNPNAWEQLPNYGAASRTAWAENVAKWTTDRYTTQAIFDSYMASPGHRANILGAGYRFVGVGTVSANTSPCAGNDFNTMTFTDRVDEQPAQAQTVALRALANNRYVAAENAGNSPLIANRAAPALWETFELVNRGGNDVALRSSVNGRYVTAEAGGAQPLIANRSAAAAWETFELIRNADGTVSLRSRANGRFVVAEPAGAQPLIANRTAIGGWEKFTLVTR